MRLTPASVDGAYVVELDRLEDERGFFARTWCSEEFARHGLNPELVQCSISRNLRSGTLRGMHFQRPPHEEAKLVRCTHGAIFDVVLDLREPSSTRGAWFGVELTEVSGRALYIPEGCAHGFQTLSDGAEVLYLISHRYVPEAAGGVRWDDPAFAIRWPNAPQRTISERDRGWPDFAWAGAQTGSNPTSSP